MGKYGVKICNIQASTLYETNIGVRDHFEYKRAMFTNSLLLDFLQDNGLKMHGKNVTRDIICLDFKWGTRSYKQELHHLRKISKQAKLAKDNIKRKKIIKIYKEARSNKSKYTKLTKEELRNYYYVNGVDVSYIKKNKNGDIEKEIKIHYKMLFRSTGKAKKGSCMFIKSSLYKKAYNFLTMGINIPKKNAPVVEINGYMPLAASTIIDKIQINPKNILILKDIDSLFKTKVVSVETDENRHCIAKTIDNYMVKNTMFDGQALIDHSIFPEWADGYILLRHHFTKMATVDTEIQLFFRDYFMDDYENAVVVDMFGNDHYAKDIQLITTENAMKWIKFDVSYEYWCEKVFENECNFGIVKTAHNSKLGDFQRMSYQMVNTLDIGIMEDIVKDSVDYVTELKTNENIFLDYLERNKNFSNDHEVLIALVKQNKEFLRCDYFRSRKKRIIRTYVDNLKSGKIIQDADNLVLIGSPYAMLLHSVGENVDKDDTLSVEDGAIQCYTERFKHDELLAGFRSPHNSPNNTIPLHNVISEKMRKYFNFGNLIMAVNVNSTDIQDRANGCDFDSDQIYCTNQPKIVTCVYEYYKKFPTIVNNIQREKNNYDNCFEHYSLIDNNLAISSTIIGESSNLAQLALTYTYNFDDTKYEDYVCILSVLAQVAIDSAKRRFDVDLDQEIKRIKKDMELQEHGLPEFWGAIKDVNKKRINKNLICPMNYLCRMKIPEFKPETATLPISHFFVKFQLVGSRRKCKKVEWLIEKYSLDLYNFNIDLTESENNKIDYLLLRSDFDKLIEDINKTYISKNYLGLMSWLIDRAFVITATLKRTNSQFESRIEKNKSILLKTLFDINPKNLLEVFNSGHEN